MLFTEIYSFQSFKKYLLGTSGLPLSKLTVLSLDQTLLRLIKTSDIFSEKHPHKIFHSISLTLLEYAPREKLALNHYTKHNNPTKGINSWPSLYSLPHTNSTAGISV